MMGLTLGKTPDIGVLQVIHKSVYSHFIRLTAASCWRPAMTFFLNTDPVLQEIAANAVLRHYLEFSHEQPLMNLMMEWTTPKHLIVKNGNAGLVSPWTSALGLPLPCKMYRTERKNQRKRD
jgi:hypothetical protein